MKSSHYSLFVAVTIILLVSGKFSTSLRRRSQGLYLGPYMEKRFYVLWHGRPQFEYYRKEASVSQKRQRKQWKAVCILRSLNKKTQVQRLNWLNVSDIHTFELCYCSKAEASFYSGAEHPEFSITIREKREIFLINVKRTLYKQLRGKRKKLCRSLVPYFWGAGGP